MKVKIFIDMSRNIGYTEKFFLLPVFSSFF